MRRRFTSAMTLWKARSWRSSSGWATAAAIVPRTRAGEGDRAMTPASGGGASWHINHGLYQSPLMLGRRSAVSSRLAWKTTQQRPGRMVHGQPTHRAPSRRLARRGQPAGQAACPDQASYGVRQRRAAGSTCSTADERQARASACERPVTPAPRRVVGGVGAQALPRRRIRASTSSRSWRHRSSASPSARPRALVRRGRVDPAAAAGTSAGRRPRSGPPGQAPVLGRAAGRHRPGDRGGMPRAHG